MGLDFGGGILFDSNGRPFDMRFKWGMPAIFILGIVFLASGCANEGLQDLDEAIADVSGSRMFVLKNLEGQDVSLESHLKQNKAVLLNFWATWCPPCAEEIPDLIKLQEKHKGDAFTILGIDVAESDKKVGRFAKKMGINYPVLLDSRSEVAEEYGIVGIPTSLLVNQEGKVIGKYYGFTRELVADVESALK